MKPQPIAEITIKKFNAIPEYLHIWASTPDMRGWIEAEAPTLGSLFSNANEGGHYTLFLSPNYDADQVTAWLQSGGLS